MNIYPSILTAEKRKIIYIHPYMYVYKFTYKHNNIMITEIMIINKRYEYQVQENLKPREKKSFNDE